MIFVDAVYKFWTERNFNPTGFDSECKKWVLLLLQLVNVTEDDSHIYLEVFLVKSNHKVVVKYQKEIREQVSAGQTA